MRVRLQPVQRLIIGGFVSLAFAVYALMNWPILAHTPGAWDCACGDMYIKTTRKAIWNPFRDRTPERVANDFFLRLRANECQVGENICHDALPHHRVSDWRLAYREDSGSAASLYFKLTKLSGERPYPPLGGVGAVALRKFSAGWKVVSYDRYF